MLELNTKAIAALPAPAKGNRFCGFAGATVQGKPVPQGLGVVVTAAGVRSFVLNYRIAGKERRYTLGRCSDWPVPKAIERARELRQEIERGNDPLGARQEARKLPVKELTVADVVAHWGRLKGSTAHRDGAFNNFILPALGPLPLKELRKGHIIDLQDDIRERAGPSAANRYLRYFQSVLNWQEQREEDWRAPSFAGRYVKEVSRDRVVSDDEIRALWSMPDDRNSQLAKLLMLTAQRRSEVGDMLRSWIAADGATVTIPAIVYKTRRQHTFPLSGAAQSVLATIPLRDDGRLFATWGYHAAKAALGVEWNFHDLRRTAQTIMARNRVRPEVCERVLGHAQPGIAAVYDRHQYAEEKAEAVEILAQAIERVVNPPAPNVPICSA